MVTWEQLELAKESWEQARIGSSIAHDNWRLISDSRASIINSLLEQGFSSPRATKAFNDFYEERQTAYLTLFNVMNERAGEYKRIEDQWKAQKSAENS